jgi:hypothetical protein
VASGARGGGAASGWLGGGAWRLRVGAAIACAWVAHGGGLTGAWGQRWPMRRRRVGATSAGEEAARGGGGGRPGDGGAWS